MQTDSENLSDARLLLVDDDVGTIQVLRHILGEFHDLRFATSGAVGIDLARHDPPDLILLDFEMPGMGGMETFWALRTDERLAAVPVIFVTSHDEANLETEMLDQGAADFIGKPLHPQIVRARVRTQLRLKRLTDRLRDMARRDGLTGVANRLAFDEMLEREWRRSARGATCLSLLMIDVDHFKKYNDSQGHLQGDDALRQVAHAIARAAGRVSDFVARYGGEEFAVILPNTAREEAQEMALRLRHAVEDLRIPHPASSTAAHVTVSIGISTVEPTRNPSSDGGGSPHLVQAADKALYEAKRAGRNRTAFQAFVPVLREEDRREDEAAADRASVSQAAGAPGR